VQEDKFRGTLQMEIERGKKKRSCVQLVKGFSKSRAALSAPLNGKGGRGTRNERRRLLRSEISNKKRKNEGLEDCGKQNYLGFHKQN